jgi:DNA repair protein RecO (recombination protein O)
MTIRQDEAVILRTRDYRESDRLITFFSRSQGQLTGIAKGARRSKKRFVHTLEPLSHVLITYADRSSSGLVRIDASELKNGFIELRTNLIRLGYASLSCEVVLEMSPERQANPTLFTLLYHYLNQLEGKGEPEDSCFLFLLRMLSLSGYAPNFQTCLHCGRISTAGQAWHFSIPQGGLLCENHRQTGKVYHLSAGTVMLLRQAQQLPLAKVWRLRFHRQSRDECRFLLLDLVRHHLEKDLKSLRLLYQIGALEVTTSSANF